jgi:O-antigen/teichoic acid export membrane protein
VSVPPAWAAVRAQWPPAVAEMSRRFRTEVLSRRTFGVFALSMGAVNVSSLLGNAIAFHWIDPGSMGVWHTLLLLSSYLSVLRLGLVNGMGRELPFALGSGDLVRARRIAATSLYYNVLCSVLAGLTFVVVLGFRWSSGPAWRTALPAMAVVSAATLYLSYLQATFRSDRDFERLSRTQWLQAGLGLLLPVMVYAFRFAGLCLHAVLQIVAVTLFAHSMRPFRVQSRFEPQIARELLATGLPLFLASYLQILATGFDRVILLRRGTVETVGYYAPALAVIAAMAIVPNAVGTYVYPRMSYALGRGRTAHGMRGMALAAGGVSLLAGLPVAVAGWFAAPAVISGFFPKYTASIPAVRWSLLAGLLLSVQPAAQVLGSLKAWRSLAAYIAVVLVTRWAFPWFLSDIYDPLEGVARGNVWAAAVGGVLSLVLVYRATVPRPEAA